MERREDWDREQREDYREKRKRQNDNLKRRRASETPPPLYPYIEFSRSDHAILQCRYCFFKASGYDKLELEHQNLVFCKLIKCIIKKICHGVIQKVKLCAIDETECNETWSHYLRIDQKRKKGWWRGRRERIEKGSRERIDIERKETKRN